MPEDIGAQSSALLEKVIPYAIEYGIKLVGAIILYIIGRIIIKMVTNLLKKLIKRQISDKTLEAFLVSFAGGIMQVILWITIISVLGIQATSLVAILGAAGLAIGMALSGTLQNFAAGVMLLTFRPYKIGDFVEVDGHAGKVKEIQIFNTLLTTGDNKTIIIPNATASSNSLVNYSTQEKRRVDLVFGIGYQDSIDTARSVLEKIITAEDKILKNEETLIAVSGLGDNSVNITVRVWVKSDDYWDVYFGMTETVKKTFDKEKISFPYPQRDVHMHSV